MMIAALFLWACTSSPTNPAPLMSLWGAIITVGQAEQTDAPAIWPEADRVRLLWIGADQSGVHQDIRAVTADGLSDQVVLPLPHIHPYAQQVTPAQNDNLHLLWLDDNQSGETRLYDAEITASLEVEHGQTLVSEQSAVRYIIIPREDSGMWVISSGGLLAEPGLFIRDVDAVGRPRLAESTYRLTSDADWPAFDRRSDGMIDLYWIAHSDGRVFRGTLVDGTLQNPQPISTTVSLNTGDRLETFSAGVDHSHAYLFWNITRAGGQAETWFTTASLDSQDWSAPYRLQVDTTLNAPFETGFNSGSALAAQAGSTPFIWAKPLDGQFDTLPVAGTLGKTRLALLYFRDGQVAGYQDIAATVGLIGVPNLVSDRDRHLYLAWAEPTPAGYAALNLTMTRHF
jgi:hypothetical protein